jgi:hypothetical protein
MRPVSPRRVPAPISPRAWAWPENSASRRVTSAKCSCSWRATARSRAPSSTAALRVNEPRRLPSASSASARSVKSRRMASRAAGAAASCALYLLVLDAPVGGERRQIEVALAAEGVVEAAAAQRQAVVQVAYGGRFVALLPEQLHGALEQRRLVECLLPCHCRDSIAYFGANVPESKYFMSNCAFLTADAAGLQSGEIRPAHYCADYS